MEPFKRDTCCPSCGSSIMAVFELHLSGRDLRATSGASDELARCPTDVTHMHRTCLRCAHEWAELPPLDGVGHRWDDLTLVEWVTRGSRRGDRTRADREDSECREESQSA